MSIIKKQYIKKMFRQVLPQYEDFARLTVEERRRRKRAESRDERVKRKKIDVARREREARERRIKDAYKERRVGELPREPVDTKAPPPVAALPTPAEPPLQKDEEEVAARWVERETKRENKTRMEEVRQQLWELRQAQDTGALDQDQVVAWEQALRAQKRELRQEWQEMAAAQASTLEEITSQWRARQQRAREDVGADVASTALRREQMNRDELAWEKAREDSDWDEAGETMVGGDELSEEEAAFSSGTGRRPEAQGLPVSDFEEAFLAMAPGDRQPWTQVRQRILKNEKMLARSQGRELSELEKRQILARVTDALASPIGRIEMEMLAYANNFDRAGLDQKGIQNTRRLLRQEFLAGMYASMSDTQIEKFRDMRQNLKYELSSDAMQEKLLQRDSDRKAAYDLRVLENMQRNARKKERADNAGIVALERPASFREISPLRTQILRSVVQPKFQVSRHLDTMVNEMRAMNPEAVTPVMLAQASMLSRTPVTGRTFFPPQNANPTIVYPWKVRFAPPTKPMPSYMNWADTSNVAAVRGWKLPRVRLSRARRVGTDKQGYMHEVVDQLGCGSCWVISVAGAMSDRASIWTQEANPQLSITNILGCVSGDGSEGEVVAGASMYSPATAGCAGGLPMGAVEMFANFGDATSACVGYDWCINDPVCNQNRRLGFSDSPAYLNSIMPACADMLETCLQCDGAECESSTTPRKAWGLKTYPSGRPYILLTDALSIQQEIAAHGPVVATHAIYGDFQNGTAAILGDGWVKTRGVYCNVQTAGARRPYSGTRYSGSERQLIGYHAVTIIGWGVEPQVPDWETPGATLDIPYWIVRNSWGTQWNEGCMVNGINMPGHCKIAMTNRARNINTKVYLDTTDDGLVGAAIAFMPMVTRVDPPSAGEALVDVEPQMYEDKIESVEEMDVTLTSTVQDANGSMEHPDATELTRDQLNHPVLCLPTTPHTLNVVNCDGRQLSRASWGSTNRPKSSWCAFPFLLALTTIITAVLVILVLIRRKRGARH